MSEFIFHPQKSKRNKPTIKVGQTIETRHGTIKVLAYSDRHNVKILFKDGSIQPNPQFVAVKWIRKNEIKPGENNE